MENQFVQPNYQLPKTDLGGRTTSSHIAQLGEIQKWVEALGVNTKGTRIDRYLRWLRQVESGEFDAGHSIFHDPPDNPFKSVTDRLLYVFREVHELMWIHDGLNASESRGLSEKLSQAIGGADFAALDRRSVSRDTQFELRVAAYFGRGDYRIDLSSETDIVVKSRYETFFVECKRVASPKQLERRVKEASKQLGERLPRSRMFRRFYGLIAIDVTKVGFSHNGLTFGVTADHARDVIREKLAAASNDVRRFDWLFEDRNHLAVLLQIHMPSQIVFPPQAMTVFSSDIIINPRIRLRGAFALRRFYSLLPFGIEPSANDIPPRELRETFVFPEGTTIGCDSDLFKHFMDTGELPARDKDSEVLKVIVAGVETRFVYGELQAIMTLFEDDFRLLRKADEGSLAFEAMARLYAQRYPYVEDSCAPDAA